MMPPSSHSLATPQGGRPPAARQSRFRGGKLGRGLARRGLLALGLAVLSGCATTPANAPAEVRQALAPTGTLRIAAYTGSPTSLVPGGSPGQERGVAVELGRELARRLGVPAQIVLFERPAEIIEGLKAGRADLTLTNASPARAKEVDFTPAVLRLESGYLAAPGSRVTTMAQVDAPGVRVGVAQGSSSQATLSRDLKAAQVVPVASVSVAAEQLRQGQLDLFASNKGILFDMSDRVPGSRVLEGRWALEQLALGVPQGRQAAAAWLQAFVADPATRALVRQAAQRAGLRGLATDSTP